MNSKKLKSALTLAVVLIALGVYAWREYQGTTATTATNDSVPAGDVAATSDHGSSKTGDDAVILKASRDGRSGVVVESSGVVEKVLPDDREGSRHQRFIVRLDNDLTVLMSHNIDLAPRVGDIDEGDRVEFRGQYEWNDRGGVIHWTHHDPDGRRPGGWIRHHGREYR